MKFDTALRLRMIRQRSASHRLTGLGLPLPGPSYLAPALGDIPIIASAHPSPMSADRGFFGSRPFSRANAALVAAGADPIDWDLSPGA